MLSCMANATIVTVGFDYGSSHFRLRVKDNGRGIEAGVRESALSPDISACLACESALDASGAR